MGKKKPGAGAKKMPVQEKKIMLMGLDNAGKTSIYLSLDMNTNLLEYCGVNPTRGLNLETIKIAGSCYSIWDFGGQEQFRDDYIESFEKYVAGVSKIIYVIDVKDKERYGESLKYMRVIMEKIRDRDENIPLSIFLHKFDRDIENDPEFSDERIQVELLDKIEPMMSEKIPFGIYKTTIFTIFQKTMIA